MRFVPRALAIVLALPACSNPGDEPPPSVQAVGVLVEEARIDGYDEDLVPIEWVAMRADGAIAFTQAQDGQVRIYGSGGEAIGRFGARGDGPGDFTYPNRLGWHGDTLWVYDSRLGRISVVSPELGLISANSNLPATGYPAPEEATRVPEFSLGSLFDVDRDGMLYRRMGLAANQVVPPEFRDRTLGLGSVSQDGEIDRILALVPTQEGGMVPMPNSEAFLTMPFGNLPRYDVSLPGGRAVVAMASIEGPDAGSYALTAIDLQGDTLFSERFAFPVEVLPASVADSAIQATSALRLFPADQADAMRREAHVPPIYPPLNELLLGRDGSSWIQLREEPQGLLYHVVDENGVLVGTVFLPPRSRVAAATVGLIWVVERDELDVESLVNYRVEWPN